uniref:Acetamidase n=1 Tax=Talaromyces marneffei PM1 TaxID=1077442 RepID=A0A093VG61_TALMA
MDDSGFLRENRSSHGSMSASMSTTMISTVTPITYQERARIKRSIQGSLIPAEWRLASVPPVGEVADVLEYIRKCNLLSAGELSITETSDVNTLLHKLASRQLSSLEVTKAFAKRAMLAHQLTNCCTEIFLEDAFDRARQLDDYLEQTGELIGPLHGLPVSIKDLFDAGWASRISRRRKMETPQQHFADLMSDSYNHVFGQCVSTLNRNLISGGSSGGESSLMLADQSGFRPIYVGFMAFRRAQADNRMNGAVAGPMAMSLSTVEKYMEALPAARPWEIDHQVTPIPWQTELCTTTKRLRIGYVIDDGVVKVQPPVARAVEEVIQALREAGHEVFEWDASSHAHAYQLWEKAILSDGGAACRRLCELSGEPLIEGMLVGKPHNILTTSQTHQYLRRWASASLDALIMPITPWVGYKPQTWVKSHQYVGYTSISNLLDYPALAIPVTKVDRTKDDRSLDKEWMTYQPRNKSDEFNHQQYDIDLIHGAPVGVQVITPKLQEEKCIAVAKVIEESLAAQRSAERAQQAKL